MEKVKTFIKETKQFFYLTVFIILIILFSLYNSLKLEDETHYNIALSEAKNSFEKDVVYRKWVALEGGVYVPITEYTPPNPYLNVPNRDVETKEGLKLTLVNPSYMTRMVHGLERKFGRVDSRIVSLSPINPQNKPDDWEAKALKEFEKGSNEKHELQDLNGKKFLRYIAAFKVEQSCLKCHSQQGYKVGDIRGGISVKVPFDEHESLLAKDQRNLIVFHLGAIAVSLVFLFFGAYNHYNQKKNLIKSKQELIDVSDFAGIGYWEMDLRKDIISTNEGWMNNLGYVNQSVNKISYYISLVKDEDKEKLINIFDDLRAGKINEFSVEHRVLCNDGSARWVLTKGKVVEWLKGKPIKISGVQIDIDRDKKIIEKIFEQQNQFKAFFEYSTIPTSISRLKDGKYLDVNIAWEKTTGYKKEDVVGKTSIELNLWYDTEDRNKFVNLISENGYIKDVEFRAKNRYGKKINALVSAVIIEIENEKYVLANIKEITEERKLQQIFKSEKEIYSFFNFIYSRIDKITFKEIFEYSIEYLTKLTQSKLGLLFHISSENKEINLTAFNQLAHEFFTKEVKRIYSFEEAGEWIECINTNQTVIKNQVDNNNYSKPLISKLNIQRFINIPLYLGEKPFIVIGVANKDEEYDDVDVKNFELFVRELSKLIEEKYFINRIQENERFISSVLRNLPGFVYRCANDQNWTMIYLSENAINYIGYSNEELIENKSLSYNDLILPEYRQFIWDKIQESLEADKPYEFEYQIKKKDGNVIWVWERGKCVKDNKGNLLFLEGFITDITEKKNLELKVIESEKLFKLIAENTGDVISVLDLNLNYTYVSPSVVNVIGYSPEEVIKLGVHQVVLPDYFEIIKSILIEELENEKKLNVNYNRSRTIVLQQYHSNRNIVWTENTVSFLRDENNKPIGVIVVSRDITQKKKLESELKQSEEKFRSIFYEHSAPKMIISSENGKILEVNKKACEFYGFKANELLEKTIFDLEDDLYQESKDFIKEVLSKKNYRLERKHVLANGQKVDVEIFTSLLRMNRRDYIHLIITDVSANKKLQRYLEESERRFNRLIDNVKDTVLRYNLHPVLKFDYLNDHITEISGYPKEEFLNDPKFALKLIHPDDIEKIINITSKSESEIKKPFVLRWITKDGAIKWMEHRLLPIYNENGKLIAIEGILRDITERVQYERILVESERKYRSLFEKMNSGFVLFEVFRDSDGNPIDLVVLAANRLFTEATGLELEKSIGHRLTKILPGIEKDEANWIGKYIEVATTGKPITFENYSELLKKHFSVSAFQSEPDRCAVTFVDITERKQKDIELKKLISAIEQSPVSVVITDYDGNIEYVNKYFTELTGYTFEEVKGKNPRILSAGKHTKEFYKELWNRIKSGYVWEGIFYNVKKDGSHFWESAVITPIKDENKRIINFVAVKKDITDEIIKEQQLKAYRENLERLVEEKTKELKKLNADLVEQLNKEQELEEQLKESLNKEKELNELKTKFFAAVSHEFRTPLAGILTSAQMIRRYGKKWTEEKLESHYQNIENLISHLTSMVDDILILSRADREIIKNQPKPQNIEKIFNEIIELLKPSIPDDRKLIFENLCKSEVLNLDSKLIHHIVQNLITNAVKFGFENTNIYLTISEEDMNLVIKVRDSGIGIPEEDLSRIFEPFYRSDNAIAKKGSGLGLNIVKRCVDIANGQIYVESKINQGSTFTVRIPYYE
ncbi:MAG: PAS domain S-box protein [Ignavibacterium sp.]|nr:PAS domain S-box protein [Ignavibacterium sp.]MDW8375767.1 PAS domain S-box protein [Ignavibacteriales bacterium]